MTRDVEAMTNDQSPMTNEAPNPNAKRAFDLAERTARFGEEALRFANRLQKTCVSQPLISQFVRSTTSIAANYTEADEAGSHKDFLHKITICKKEARETCLWCRMIATADPSALTQTRRLWKEAHELVLIFAAIIKKGKERA